MNSTVHEIALDDIQVSDLNVRDSARDKGVEDLAESIAALGLLQPVVLVGQVGHTPYDLLIGQRRYRAHKLLEERGDLPEGTIKAVFADPGDALKLSAMSLAENLHRVEINHADAAKAVTALYKHYSRDMDKVRAATGLSKHMITKYVYIDERASEHMKQLLRDHEGAIGPDDVRRALSAAHDDIDKAERILDLMVEHELTRHDKTRLAEHGKDNPDATPEELVEMAERPIIQRSVTVALRGSIRSGVEQAVGELHVSPEELATLALQEWLSDKGFL